MTDIVNWLACVTPTVVSLMRDEIGRLTDTSSTGYVTINNHKAIFVFDRYAPPHPITLPQCQNDPKGPSKQNPFTEQSLGADSFRQYGWCYETPKSYISST